MPLLRYLSLALLLTAGTVVVFRVLVRHDYERRGQLSPLTVFFELFIWFLLICFPFLYNPPEWVLFWSGHAPVGMAQRIVGVVIVSAGALFSFGTMVWFGIGRAIGVVVSGLVQVGPYRYTRNPQIIGGALMVLGCALLWPSWYAVGWLVLYCIVSHSMVLTEEEHLKRVFGLEYERYCARVPRYIGRRLEA